MLLMKNLSWRTWLATNLLLALLAVNLAVFGPALRMGGPFTAGLLTGVLAGWLIFAVGGYLVLKRGGRAWDERRQANARKASAFAFWILILAADLAAILLRSERLGLAMEARDLAALLANLGLASFGLAWVVAERR